MALAFWAGLGVVGMILILVSILVGLAARTRKYLLNGRYLRLDIVVVGLFLFGILFSLAGIAGACSEI